MAALPILIDFDNVDSSLKQGGPTALARALVLKIPQSIVSRHSEIVARLYGGWRSNGSLTVAAQKLVPDLRQNSPAMIGLQGGNPIKITVELADRMIGSAVPFEQTYVRERSLRPFRVTNRVWTECSQIGANCGFNKFSALSLQTTCSTMGCANTLEKILVRDEQKMVDTLLVADIAYQSLSQKATDVVVVSSDTDMWPGVLLAVQSGCNVIHLHTKMGGTTQRHLLNTLNAAFSKNYQQISF